MRKKTMRLADRATIIAFFVVSFAISFGDFSMAQTKDEIETRNKAVVQAGFDAWSAGTGSPYDLLADDASWTIVGHSAASNTYPSKAAFMSEVIRPFNARMKVGLKPTIRNMYADGDTVIVFFDTSGTARDGKPYVTRTPGSSTCATARSSKHSLSSTASSSTSFGNASSRSREAVTAFTNESLTLDKAASAGRSLFNF
jgi:ketosteroid isomerase-like protein